MTKAKATGERHWAINGRFLDQPVTGVQRYGREVLRALDTLLWQRPDLACDLRVELLVPRGTSIPSDLRAIEHREIGSGSGHLWEQCMLATHIKGGLLSLCNTGPILRRKHVVCIHDANTFNAPLSYAPRFRALYRVLLPALGRSARQIVTVSDFSRSELLRHAIVPEKDICIAPDGHEHALRWAPCHSAKTQEVASHNTIVLLGSAAPHKNAALILGMASTLAANGFRIAVVGATNQRVFKSLHDIDLAAPNIRWLGALSDAELAALLRDSLCLAFPSLTEGFGLPALEAMTVGCAVVASDQASLPEVCGDGALYAAPCDQNQWLDRFLQLKRSDRLRAQLVERGKARSALFSWTDSATRYLELMAEIDGLGAPQGRRKNSPGCVHALHLS